MRYIPMSRFSIAEIEQQCRDAINRAPAADPSRDECYDEILTFYRWEDDLLIAA